MNTVRRRNPDAAQLREALLHAERCHIKCQEQLHAFIDDTQRGFRMTDSAGDTLTFKAGGHDAAVFRLGLTLAAQIIGDFPIKADSEADSDEGADQRSPTASEADSEADSDEGANQQ